jgi:AcrR family transcriptional regulator
MPGRGRPRHLSIDEVIDAALELIDEHGTDALSMQSLARRLGTGSATLYNYVASRDELIDLMLGRVLAEQPRVPRVTAGADWAESLVGYMTGLFRAGLARPAVLQLWQQRPHLHLGAVAVTQEELLALESMGFSATRAAEVYRILGSQLVGHLVLAAGLARRPETALATPGTPLGAAQQHLDGLGEERIYESAVRLLVDSLVKEREQSDADQLG